MKKFYDFDLFECGMADVTKIVYNFYKYNFHFNASHQNECLPELLPETVSTSVLIWKPHCTKHARICICEEIGKYALTTLLVLLKTAISNLEK